MGIYYYVVDDFDVGVFSSQKAQYYITVCVQREWTFGEQIFATLLFYWREKRGVVVVYLRSTTYNSNRKLQNTHISHLHFFVVTAQRKVLSICVLQTTTVHTLSNQSYSLSLFRSMLCKFSFFPYFFAIIFFGLCKNGGHFLPGPQGYTPFNIFKAGPFFWRPLFLLLRIKA